MIAPLRGIVRDHCFAAKKSRDPGSAVCFRDRSPLAPSRQTLHSPISDHHQAPFFAGAAVTRPRTSLPWTAPALRPQIQVAFLKTFPPGQTPDTHERLLFYRTNSTHNPGPARDDLPEPLSLHGRSRLPAWRRRHGSAFQGGPQQTLRLQSPNRNIKFPSSLKRFDHRDRLAPFRQHHFPFRPSNTAIERREF